MTMRKLKIYFLLFTFLLSTASIAYAKPTITSDSKTFNIATGEYILEGNVSIATDSRVITAGKARVKLISLEVWGSDGVNVNQSDLNFSGDTVYVNGKNSTAQIDGGVDLVMDDLSIHADSVEYNWKTKTADFSGNITLRQNETISYFNTLQYNIETNTLF